MIPSPRRTDDYPDRNLECQEAIEAGVLALVDEAKASGWNMSDVTTALGELADNLMLMDQPNADTERMIAVAIAKRTNE